MVRRTKTNQGKENETGGVVRALALASLCVLVAGDLFACTFTRSLDYLTNGGSSDGGTQNDGSSSSSSGATTDGPVTINPADGFVKAQFNPQNLTQDTDTIYWSTGDSAIMAAPKATGIARKVGAATPGSPITWLAADPGNGQNGFVYAINGDSVRRIPKAGGDLTFVEKDIVKPAAVVVDDANIFVAHSDLAAAETGNVARFAKDGTNRVVLSVEGDDPPSVAIQGNSVFWAGTDPISVVGVIFEAPKNAGPDAGGLALTHKPSNANGVTPDALASAFAVDADAIFYFEVSRVMRLGRQGSPAPTIVFEARTGTTNVAFAIDNESVFVAELRPDGTIIRAPKMGGLPTPLASNTQTAPTSIIVDDQFVYYTVEGTKTGPDGAVVRIAKK